MKKTKFEDVSLIQQTVRRRFGKNSFSRTFDSL